MARGFLTIGHSTRTLAEFLDLLRENGVDFLADVRSFPHSRANPAFNIESFPGALAHRGIGYEHFTALGGRRSHEKGIDAAVNGFWRVRGFHNYADYALGPEFQAAFERLVTLGAAQRVAIMCAEAVWWRCHRRIITDYLLLNGHPVLHIMGPGHVDAAHPTPGAQRRDDGKVLYPAAG